MNFSDYNLHTALMSGIESAGYVTCTPVQEEVLKIGMDGSDLYVQSQTGTGKTAAYLITILQRMLETGDTPQQTALILVPTRELAVQVEKEAATLAQGTNIRMASFYGGVGYQQQEKNLREGVNLIIGTPGRVIDLEKSGTMKIKTISFLVIDEADRMFDMGFYPDLRTLLHTVSAADARQTMLFSATLNTWVKNLAWEYTRNAKEITIDAESVTVDEINQTLFHVSADKKTSLLLGLLKKEKPENAIIFCNTKKTSEIIAKRLEINGYNTGFLIGDLPQPKRLKLIEQVKKGKLSCLVATDVAARGIDIDDLSMVINYDLPLEAENYVHRIGRTARAGKSGTAYNLCSEQDVYSLPDIEKYLEAKIPAVVPADDDFAEDKSEGIYIQLDKYGKNRQSERSKNRSGKTHRRMDADYKKTRSKNTKQTGKYHKDVKKGGVKTSKKTHEKEENQYAGSSTEHLENLSFEERMAYYRQHYAGHLTGKDTESTGKSIKSACTAHDKKRRKNQQPKNRKQAKERKNTHQPQRKAPTQEKAKAAEQTRQASKTVQQKSGILSTIKQLFLGK